MLIITTRKLVIDDSHFVIEIILSCKYDGVLIELLSIKRLMMYLWWNIYISRIYNMCMIVINSVTNIMIGILFWPCLTKIKSIILIFWKSKMGHLSCEMIFERKNKMVRLAKIWTKLSKSWTLHNLAIITLTLTFEGQWNLRPTHRHSHSTISFETLATITITPSMNQLALTIVIFTLSLLNDNQILGTSSLLSLSQSTLKT